VEGPTIEVGRGFYRGHGLGNDYLVFEAAAEGERGFPLTPGAVRAICRRGEGEGSDGIVVLLDRAPADGVFPLRMFNPDGSEFERSGNGLRVVASHLVREGLVTAGTFRVRSGGVEIPMRIHPGAPPGSHDVSVEMGRARAGIEAVPVESEHLDSGGRAVHPELGPIPFTPVHVGNPHVVVFRDEVEGPPASDPDEDLRALGAFLTGHPAFPGGVNVQLVRKRSPGRLRIAIWERGVGRTPASGTSSCAAAVAAVSRGLLDPGRVRVAMDGGELQVEVSRELDVVLRGPVAEVAEGRLTDGFVERLGADPG
jgi:diaminopimelate epimerase